MRACIVGCGQECDWTHGNITQHFEGIDWVDLNIERAEYFYNINKRKQKNSSYGMTVKTSGVNLGIILTPNGSHKSIAEQFINKNIPVFIEKPIALSWDDLLWFEEQEQKGAWITTGYQCRFLNSIISIKKELELNPPLIIDCWKHRGRGHDYYSDWHGKWKTDGGVICQQGIHALDLICFITNQVPKTISMIGGRYKHEGYIEAEDTALISLDYKDFVASIHCTSAMVEDGFGNGNSCLRVQTKLGGHCSAEGFAWNNLKDWKKMKTSNLLKNKDYKKDMWKEIIDSIQQYKKGHISNPPIPVSEAVKSMKIAHAAYASWFDGGKPKPYGTKFDLLGV